MMGKIRLPFIKQGDAMLGHRTVPKPAQLGKIMSDTITARFESCREADLAVEHLVQEHGIERADIVIEPESDDNSEGETAADSDAKSEHSGVDMDCSPALEGAITVLVDVNDEKSDSYCPERSRWRVGHELKARATR